jgi:hypothetical protein
MSYYAEGWLKRRHVVFMKLYHQQTSLFHGARRCNRTFVWLALLLLLVQLGLADVTGLVLCIGADGHVALQGGHDCCEKSAPQPVCGTSASQDVPFPADFCSAEGGSLAPVCCLGSCVDFHLNPGTEHFVLPEIPSPGDQPLAVLRGGLPAADAGSRPSDGRLNPSLYRITPILIHIRAVVILS